MSIVEKMARAAHESKHRGMKNVWAWGDPGLIAEHREYVDEIDAMMRAALTATGLTEAQLEGLANGTMVVVPADQAIGPYYERQIEWSRQTFGPGTRTLGVLDHIRKELGEIAQAPNDLTEWADVIILAMDGFWRHGGTAEGLMQVLLTKQKKNFARQWPDWRTMPSDKAIEHDRSQDRAMLAAKEG